MFHMLSVAKITLRTKVSVSVQNVTSLTNNAPKNFKFVIPSESHFGEKWLKEGIDLFVR